MNLNVKDQSREKYRKKNHAARKGVPRGTVFSVADNCDFATGENPNCADAVGYTDIPDGAGLFLKRSHL